MAGEMVRLRELAVAVVAPGWRWRRERPAVGAALLFAGVAVPVIVALVLFASLVRGRSWVAISLDRSVLGWMLVALAAALVSRVAALVLWWLAGERTRERIGAGAIAALLAVVPLSVGVVDVARARSDIAPVFTPTDGDAAVFDPDAPDPATPATTPETTTEPPTDVRPTTTEVPERGPRPTIDIAVPSTSAAPLQKPQRPRSGVDPAAVADVYNILLLGGDAGPGRSGLRTDTMMILSVHTPSGRASLVSLPRDMRGLLFPPGSALEARYPYGFTELANAVYPIVSANAGLRSAYESDADIRPGVVAAAQAIGYSLDLPIHDYVLIDMQGFIDLIDALGGVTVRVTKTIPMPGNVPGAKHDYPPTIGPGVVEMDGTTALGYVRSRYADSDFQRTRRQRELLAALAQQVSIGDVIGRFNDVTSAVGGTLRTSLTPDELGDVLAVIGGETAIVESVGLVPPMVDIRNPDFQHLAEVVGEVRVAIAQGTSSGH